MGWPTKQTMRAAVLQSPGRIAIERVTLPEPRRSEVRIRIEGCGLCGSNLAPWEGREWFKYPFESGQPGHEGWGEIDAVGPDVKHLKVGQRVAALSYNAFAEYDVSEEDNVVVLPPSLEKKPFPGEALGCAMNVFARCDIQPGHTVAIVGIGFIGALLTELAARRGARVIAITRRPFALEMARHYGARHCLRMKDHARVIAEVKQLTSGTGCDRVIEAVGAQWPLDLAGEITRERGRLIIAGYHQDGPRQVNMQLWNWRGLDVINAHERDPKVYTRGIHDAAEAVSSGALNPYALYTHSFKLERIWDAFAAMQQRPDKFLKAIVTV